MKSTEVKRARRRHSSHDMTAQNAPGDSEDTYEHLRLPDGFGMCSGRRSNTTRSMARGIRRAPVGIFSVAPEISLKPFARMDVASGSRATAPPDVGVDTLQLLLSVISRRALRRAKSRGHTFVEGLGPAALRFEASTTPRGRGRAEHALGGVDNTMESASPNG